MKTMQELYTEIVASDELKKAFVEALKAGKLGDFLRTHDCEATEDEVGEFMEAKEAEDAPLELSDNELKHVAAGSFVKSVVCSQNGDTCGCSNTCIRDCC